MGGCSQKAPSLTNGDEALGIARQSEETASDNQGTKNYDKQILGIVTVQDTDKMEVTLKDIASGKETKLTYSGATSVLDKYQKEQTMSLIRVGEIVNAYYISKTDKLVSLQISNEAWENTKVKNLEIDSNDKIMKIASNKYRFDDNLVVVSDNELIGMDSIDSIDELTVKGIGNKIVSILVTKSHGYITIENESYFDGGFIQVGPDIVMKITEGMKIAAPVGNCAVTVSKDGEGGSRTVTIQKGQEVSVDLSYFQEEATRNGTVSFEIDPEDAILYIDGTATDYSEQVSLSYGTYTIKVTCDGYTDYEEELTVDSIYQTKTITLEDSSETTEE